MTITEIHGKLPEYEGMEDLLTSDVFSTFKYLPLELAFIPFLKRAVCELYNATHYIWLPLNKILKRDKIEITVKEGNG